MPSTDFRRLAARQHGVFSSHQAAELGIGRHRVARMVAAGEITKMLPSVYRLEGSPRSYLQNLMGAYVWAGPGSVFSHRTAGALLGLCEREEGMIEITSARRSRSARPGIIVYRRSLPPRVDVSRINGVPVTTMPRTLIDMSAVCSTETVDWALDAAIRAGMRRDLFLSRFDELSARGRDGMALLRGLVGERVHEQGLTESPFERRLLRALRRAGLPLPICQMVISDSGFAARVDFAYPDHRLVIEADSCRWHDGRSAFEHDRLRWSELASRGWRVLLVTYLQLKYKPDEVVARVRRALGL